MQTPRTPPKLPLVLAALAAAALGLSAAPQDPPPSASPAAPAEELPSARSIIDRSVEVTGGKAMVENTSSVAVKATLNLEAMGIKGTVERYSAKPSKQVIKSNLGSFGTTTLGYDGEVAWMIQPMLGTLVLKGAERLSVVMASAYDAALMPDRDYEKLEVQGRETFEGRDCYKVLAVYRAPADPVEAKETEKVRTSTSWFDVETGHLIGNKGTQAQAGSEVPATTVFSDYKLFGDYTMAAKMTQEAMGVKVVITVDTVEYDKVDPKTFELPAAVRALVEDETKPVPAGSGAGGGGG